MSIHKMLMKVVAIGCVFASLNVIHVSADTIATITGDVVNVRTSPSTDAAIVTKLQAGQTVSLLSNDGTWMKISLKDGGEAYISADFAAVTSVDASVTGTVVNVRKTPSASGEIVGKVNLGDVVTATGISGEFYAVTYNGATAYIHRDFLSSSLLASLPTVTAAAANAPAAAPAAVTSQYVLIQSSTGLNLRKSASTSAEVVTVLSNGEAVDLIAAGTEWHQVSYFGQTGFVSAEFCSIQTGTKPETSKRTELVAYAKKFLGTRYSWGGTNLTRGVDCSGFVYAVYRDFGYTLNRTSRDQIKNGTRISKSELLPGDLVFFDTTNATNRGYISHVGIYIGNGQFIHSSSSSRTPYVTINALSENYYSIRYVGATRILP